MRKIGYLYCAFASLWSISGVDSVAAQIGEAEVAQETGDSEDEWLKEELAAARLEISKQRQQLTDQQRRLDLLEQRLASVIEATQQLGGKSLAQQDNQGTVLATVTHRGPGNPIRVGEAPSDSDRAPIVPVLDQRGSVVTRKGQLIGEFGLDYGRADRNRAVFRGVELIESVLVGVFDINENRQDIVMASGTLRYGITDRFEIGARVPWVYRSDKLVATPVAGSTNNDTARTIDNSVTGSGIGDIELTARYQLNDGGRNTPFLIANLQATLPTGRDPFSVRRDANGTAMQAATGAGFVGISPSITAILPSEPAVLFATAGYTFNLAKNVDTRIPPVQIDRIEPGNQFNISLGAGLSVNNRTSINFGYAHTWTLGTKTTTRVLDQRSGEPNGGQLFSKTRDLQIGRLLVGIGHRFSSKIRVNWTFEIGATEDAPDVRVGIRVPIAF